MTVDGKTAIPDNGVPLILEEDITISFSSQFEQLVNNGGSKIIDILGKISEEKLGFGFSSHWKQLGFSTWTGTDPAEMNFTIGFYMGSQGKFSAQDEVYIPAMQLLSLTLPEERKGGNLIGPGPSLLSAFSDDSGSNTNPLFQARVIDLEVGQIFRFSNIIIQKAEPTWSLESDDQGFPIWAKVNLDIKTVFTASVNMIQSRHSGLFPPK